MMRLLALVFCASLFSVVLAHEASALRGGGIRAGGAGLRGFSAGAYRGGLRARNLAGNRAAAWGGRRPWAGRRWYGYGAGLAALAGAYAYNDPYYDDSYYGSPSYSYSSYGYPAYGSSGAYSGAYGYTSGTTGAATGEAEAVGPGMCGTYRYWKDGRCTDARSK